MMMQGENAHRCAFQGQPSSAPLAWPLSASNKSPGNTLASEEHPWPPCSQLVLGQFPRPFAVSPTWCCEVKKFSLSEHTTWTQNLSREARQQERRKAEITQVLHALAFAGSFPLLLFVRSRSLTARVSASANPEGDWRCNPHSGCSQHRLEAAFKRRARTSGQVTRGGLATRCSTTLHKPEQQRTNRRKENRKKDKKQESFFVNSGNERQQSSNEENELRREPQSLSFDV